MQSNQQINPTYQTADNIVIISIMAIGFLIVSAIISSNKDKNNTSAENLQMFSALVIAISALLYVGRKELRDLLSCKRHSGNENSSNHGINQQSSLNPNEVALGIPYKIPINTIAISKDYKIDIDSIKYGDTSNDDNYKLQIEDKEQHKVNPNPNFSQNINFLNIAVEKNQQIPDESNENKFQKRLQENNQQTETNEIIALS